MKDKLELLSIFMSFFILIFPKNFTSVNIPSYLKNKNKNGTALRKNKYLIEIIVSLMLNTNILVYHLRDAVLSACFLINKMFENKNHLSVLVLFITNISPSLDKLSAKAIKCLLRYSGFQKRYKCYSPTTKKSIISLLMLPSLRKHMEHPSFV